MDADAAHPLAHVAATGEGLQHFNTLRAPLGTVIVLTDIFRYELEENRGKPPRRDAFTLKSGDGAYERTVSPVAQDETDGMVDLVFEDVPVSAVLTLVARVHGESDETVFADIPFCALGAMTQGLDDDARPDEEG
jgi:hypothetical protein